MNLPRPSLYLASLVGTILACSAILTSAAATIAAAAADPALFPEYRVIRENVTFWEKIYSTHSVNSAIIHDQDDLGIIYETIQLLDQNLPAARQKNNEAIEKTKKRYADVLSRLAKGQKPGNTEEKRIAALFSNHGSPARFKRAAENIRAQTGLKERFSEGVARSGAYLNEFKRIFKSHGLPEDLAYLPHVESSFNPRAFSRFGASGMWQFTHETGKDFLRIDYIIDERRDPLISAQAAALLLKKNYQILGAWPLALTAYNYGAAGMKRALDQEGGYENIFSNYRQGFFKFASRNFYSEFLAAVRVAKHIEQSGRLRLDKPASSISVRLPGFADSAKLCNYLGIDQDILARYNPSLREPVFDGTKYIPQDYVIKLPAHLKRGALLSKAPNSIFSPEQKRSKFYQVRPGDTAGSIALAHNIPLSRLVQANGLDSRALIRIGQNLRIPPPVNGARRTSSAPPPSVNVAQTLKENKKQTAVPVLGDSYKQDLTVVGNLKVFDRKINNQLVSGSIEVQPDESLGLFAEWLKVTPQSLHITNNLTPKEEIHPGQTIAVDFINVSVESFEERRFDYHQELQEDFFNSYAIVGLKTYRVEEGDTVWDICYKKFDVPLWLLKKYNTTLSFTHIGSSSNLQIPILKEI